MITVQKLAQAIERRLHGTEAEPRAEARTIVSYFGQACAPTRGTNAHDVPSRVWRVPSGRRVATTRTCPCLDDPTGATIRPRGLSWGGHAPGIRGAPAVAMMQSYGAPSGYPRLPSPTTTLTSP